MSRMIDADKLSADMYHEAFEKDSDMQKWDSGCWIRYKMFENVLKAQPTVEAPDINVGNMDTFSRQQAIDAFETAAQGGASIEDIKLILAEMPSAQPEIIRCKDCKYYKYGICMKIGANKSFYGFCDWAERGEQDQKE